MFNYTLTKAGRTESLVADSRDVLVWERTNRRNRTLANLGNPHIADHYQIAEAAAKRQGIDLGDVEAWSLDIVEAEADPTPPAA